MESEQQQRSDDLYQTLQREFSAKLLQKENEILHNTCNQLNRVLDETVVKLNKLQEEDKILRNTSRQLVKAVDDRHNLPPFFYLRVTNLNGYIFTG